MDLKRLEAASSALIGNPFLAGPEHSAHRDYISNLNIRFVLTKLVASAQTELAKKLVLAVGHQAACENTSQATILGSEIFSMRLTRALPRRRSDYLRVVLAAGRCYRQLSNIHGNSTLMQQARAQTWAACFGDSLRHALELEQVIRDHDILILGETGTGKEKFALAMQVATMGDHSGNPAPASAINAAAIPENLVESELFGHVRGAFTGATDPRTGRLRSANGGSFFLDEVGDLPSTTQVKLLRVIETNDVYPVGSDSSHSVDVRYIAATHKDLIRMAECGEFRRDLYERLAGTVLHVPPLRERPEDIREIGIHFVRNYLSRKPQQTTIGVQDKIEHWLCSKQAHDYAWPGNVRELQNVLRNLLLGLAPNITERQHGSRRIAAQSCQQPANVPPEILAGEAKLDQVNRWYIQKLVDTHQGNLTRAAMALGINRSTIKRKLDGR